MWEWWRRRVDWVWGKQWCLPWCHVLPQHKDDQRAFVGYYETFMVRHQASLPSPEKWRQSSIVSASFSTCHTQFIRWPPENFSLRPSWECPWLNLERCVCVSFGTRVRKHLGGAGGWLRSNGLCVFKAPVCIKLDVVLHPYHSSTWEAEAGGWQIWEEGRLHSKILFYLCVFVVLRSRVEILS